MILRRPLAAGSEGYGSYQPEELEFERVYTAKFRALGAPAGVPIHYDLDVAALDLGIHLTSGGEVTNSRVWF